MSTKLQRPLGRKRVDLTYLGLNTCFIMLLSYIVKYANWPLTQEFHREFAHKFNQGAGLAV